MIYGHMTACWIRIVVDLIPRRLVSQQLLIFSIFRRSNYLIDHVLTIHNAQWVFTRDGQPSQIAIIYNAVYINLMRLHVGASVTLSNPYTTN